MVYGSRTLNQGKNANGKEGKWKTNMNLKCQQIKIENQTPENDQKKKEKVKTDEATCMV